MSLRAVEEATSLERAPTKDSASEGMTVDADHVSTAMQGKTATIDGTIQVLLVPQLD